MSRGRKHAATMLINGQTYHIGTPEWEAALNGEKLTEQKSPVVSKNE